MINIVRNNTTTMPQTQTPRNEGVRREMALTKTDKSLMKRKKKPIDLGLLITIFITSIFP